ncbi:DUF3224 domain-containing protein [Brachybacterium aquaticum]|uniref:DUF3224 domain-containing protein n=1 Tax=Brachybacterium aquaticum TaxID=1432564 RepID=A0A841ADM0_9MICO|nr:DUF3224 domain-containing protein [Brachybacterium aquaticum]MBB5831188.1 hypothetical protein [Brachybacterium aquaticum]
MSDTTAGTPTSLDAVFTVRMTLGDPLPGADARFDLAKEWTGGAEGTSRGVMLTAGDPETGSAGYVVSETFEGTLGGRRGTLVLQQLGTMAAGEPELQYVIVPGSGTDELAGATGTVTIGEIHDDGRHEVRIQLA